MPEMLEAEVARLLLDRGLTVAVAESCTGGLLGASLTLQPGSSAYFAGGVIAYANDVKVRELGVAESLVAEAGAVSEPVARDMSVGVRHRFGVDVGLSVTGVAGPDGGTEQKPVGLVFIGLADAQDCRIGRHRFSGTREDVRRAAVVAALEMLKSYL